MSIMNENDNSSKAASAAGKKKAEPVKKKFYKKAPQAPKRFKSAFIFFSTAKHREIREQMGKKGANEKTTNVAKLVSEAWKNLSEEDRKEWEEMSRQDKMRYEVEKSMYTGPWRVQAVKRTPKDPDAPKRPMSAFLAFSNSKRAGLKRQDPNLSNADVSRVLSKMWKEAPQEVRQKHIDEEFKKRQEYKVASANWRMASEQRKQEEREQREKQAMDAIASHRNKHLGGGTDNAAPGSEAPRDVVPLVAQLDHAVAQPSSALTAASQAELAASIGAAQLGSVASLQQNLLSMSNRTNLPFGGTMQGAVNPLSSLGSTMPFTTNAYPLSSSMYDASLLATLQQQQQQQQQRQQQLLQGSADLTSNPMLRGYLDYSDFYDLYAAQQRRQQGGGGGPPL